LATGALSFRPVTVALATSASLPGLSGDDRHLLHALRRLGVAVEPVVWEDPHYDWAAARACVIRSAWDYAYRRPAFLAWAWRVADVTPLWNPADLVEWNTHKRYLVDLAARGVPTVPTVVLSAGQPVRLTVLLEEHGWADVILKAAVAQTGRYLLRVPPDGVAAGQRHLDRLQPHEDMLLQPFLPGVTTGGEISIVFVEGELSHAVRKRPAAGEFRVHDDYGGTVEAAPPSAAELDVARRAIAAVGQPLLYARVDLVPGPAGPVVMELEVVEPDLFFGYADGAAQRLAMAIRQRLTAEPPSRSSSWAPPRSPPAARRPGRSP
jgi:glutathione synthase/RimK-type ligase-like ATP-grasp enzyme